MKKKGLGRNAVFGEDFSFEPISEIDKEYVFLETIDNDLVQVAAQKRG